MQSLSSRNSGFLGHFVFAILAAMAAWFWQERTLILDAAFQSYHFIADGRPAIMVERYGAVSVQLLPLIGVWLGASLSSVLWLYSVSIVLFHWCAFAVCLHILKDKKSALAILLFNVLLTGDSFYWMQNELLQAVTLMFVFWSLCLQRGDWSAFSVRDKLLSVFIATTIAYYHPLVFFPLAFCWLFFWLRDYPKPGEGVTKRSLYVVAALFALIFASKYILRQPNFYDRGMTGQYVREFSFSAERLLNSQSMHDFLAHLSDNFLLFLPALLLVMGFYIWKKKFRQVALVWIFTAGYIMLIMQRFLDDDRWYIQESHYQALAVFLIVPLVWDVLPAMKLPKRAVLITGLILLALRIWGIWNTHESYTSRLAYVRSIVERTKALEGRKFVIAEAEAERKTLLMYWGLPFETFQMSALESPDAVRVVAIGKNADSLALSLPRDSMPDFLMIPGHAFRDLPKQYYNMTDTGTYKPVFKSTNQQ